MISPVYRKQVELLLRVLPYLAKEEVFALKGGTAINLFVRELPRLSVDIDLTYVPQHDRRTAMIDITETLGRIKESLIKRMGIRARIIPQSDGQETRLSCVLGFRIHNYHPSRSPNIHNGVFRKSLIK